VSAVAAATAPIGNGSTALAMSVAGERLGEKAAKLGDKLTVAKAVVQAADGEPKEGATAIVGAAIDRAIGAIVAGLVSLASDGAAAPTIGAAVSAASGAIGAGDKLAE